MSRRNEKIMALKSKVNGLLMELDETYRGVTELTNEFQRAAETKAAAPRCSRESSIPGWKGFWMR